MAVTSSSRRSPRPRDDGRVARRWKLAWLIVPVCLVLTSCGGGSMGDLRSYRDKVLARESRQIEPLPELKPYETHVYASSGAKDPFEPFFQEEPDEVQPCVGEDCVRPPENHIREELEQYELDSLRMVGTLEQDERTWGIVSSPDGIIHRVEVGNYMGRNYGKIVTITEDRIELAEIVPDGRGGWRENDAALVLVE